MRKNSKSLNGCIAALLKYSFGHQWTVPKEITKAAGVNASKVTLGEPNMFTAKELIQEYYLGGAA